MNINSLVIIITVLLGTSQLHAVLKSERAQKIARTIRSEDRAKAKRLAYITKGKKQKQQLKVALAMGASTLQIQDTFLR